MKSYKPITVQYYIADYVSWVPRLTLLDLMSKLDLRTRSQNRTHSYVGDLLYFFPYFWVSVFFQFLQRTCYFCNLRGEKILRK